MGQYATVLHWGSPNGTLGKASKLQGYVRRDHPNCETTALADTESSRLGQYATVLHWEALGCCSGNVTPFLPDAAADPVGDGARGCSGWT
jgi:hypothetical protein